MSNEAQLKAIALLREPFPSHHISKLAKESRQQIDERKTNRSAGVSCKICGAWHHKNAVHLDYVGHAALTDRLLDADPLWTWEPLSIVNGIPATDKTGGMWIKLTVAGVTRYGYGCADGKTGGDAVKEVIGDALRNAAMRFGAALDLWHKGGPLHGDDAPEDDDGNAASQPRQRTTAPAPTAAPTPADWPARIEAAHATGGEPWAKACAWYAGLSAESQQSLQSRLSPAVAAALGAAS